MLHSSLHQAKSYGLVTADDDHTMKNVQDVIAIQIPFLCLFVFTSEP